jgi:hypothetical protein
MEQVMNPQNAQAESMKGKREWETPEVRKYDVRTEVKGGLIFGPDLLILGS